MARLELVDRQEAPPVPLLVGKDPLEQRGAGGSVGAGAMRGAARLVDLADPAVDSSVRDAPLLRLLFGDGEEVFEHRMRAALHEAGEQRNVDWEAIAQDALSDGDPAQPCGDTVRGLAFPERAVEEGGVKMPGRAARGPFGTRSDPMCRRTTIQGGYADLDGEELSANVRVGLEVEYENGRHGWVLGPYRFYVRNCMLASGSRINHLVACRFARRRDMVNPPKLPWNRKEVYYTATVLPMIVCQDEFAHLSKFLRLCGVVGVPESSMRQPLDFVTEYSLKQADGFEGRMVKEGDVPDVLVLLEGNRSTLLCIEAKMYSRPNSTQLRKQIAEQRLLIDGSLKTAASADMVHHALLIPNAMVHSLGLVDQTHFEGATIVTWEDVLREYESIGSPHFCGILKKALGKHWCASKQKVAGKNAEAHFLGTHIHGQMVQSVFPYRFIGRTGGLKGTAFANDVATDHWRHQLYGVASSDRAGWKNWFTAQEFMDAIQSHQASSQAA